MSNNFNPPFPSTRFDFQEINLSGAYILTRKPIYDERGFFARFFCKKEMEAMSLQSEFVQCNLSFSEKKGTLRGLHYQLPPYAEVKIVSCLRGAIYDVIVDIRKDSPTYGKWFAMELTAQKPQTLYIPQGFAHGFQTLCDDTEVFYLVGNYYHAAANTGLRWNDPKLNIAWPLAVSIISEQDKNFADF